MTWYQITFSFTSTTKCRGINAYLLSKYVEGIMIQDRKLEQPFILDVFALNIRDNQFDKSLPPFVFIKSDKKDIKLLIAILKQANIQYLNVQEVTDTFVEYYRNEYNKPQERVWSGMYTVLHKYNPETLTKYISEIIPNIQNAAIKNNVVIYDIVCPNLIYIQNGEYDKPIVVYIQHDAADNTKIERFLHYSGNIIKARTQHYLVTGIGNIDVKFVERARRQDVSKREIKQFAVRDKVTVIDGEMQGLRGTVIQQSPECVIVNINIFDTSISVEFAPQQLELIK